MCHLSRVAAMSLMVALAVSLPARALAQALTESEAVARAMAENARLRAARARPAQVAAEQRIRRLAPNPVVSFLQEDAAGTRDSFVLVQQELPTSGRLGLLKQAGTAAMLIADLRVRQAEADVRAEARLVFTRLLAAQGRLQELTTSIATLEDLSRRLSERERAGDSSTFDRLRAERELADVKAQERSAQADVMDARARLAALLGISGGESLVARGEIPAAPVAPLTAALAAAQTKRPELQAADAEVSRIEHEQRAASRLIRPQPIASVGFKQTGSGTQSGLGYTFSIGLALPLFNRGQADVAAATAALLAARAERDALAIDIEQEIRRAHARAGLLRAAADDYQRDARDRSRDLVRIATVAYDDGELGILELLDAHRSRLNAELRAIELGAEARLAAILLDRATSEEGGR